MSKSKQGSKPAAKSVVTHEEIQARFKPFCGGISRYRFVEPWYVVDGFAVATDGKVMVWIPSEPFEVPKGKRPDVRGLMQEPDGLTYQSIGKLPGLECRKCDGKGFVINYVCSGCEGAGKTPHRCDCDLCNTDYEKCEECDGKGKVDEVDARQACDCVAEIYGVLGLSFSLRFLRLIAALGPTEVVAEKERIRFRAGDFKGILMAISRDHEGGEE